MITGFQPFKTVVLVTIIIAVFLLYPLLLLFSIVNTTATAPVESINYALMDKSGLDIVMETVSPGIKAVTADTENTLVVRVQVRNFSGKPVNGAEVKLETAVVAAGTSTSDSGSSNTAAASITHIPGSAGSFRPSSGITDINGSFLTEYTPPSSTAGTQNILLTSHLAGTDKIGSIRIRLIPVPVILIHGYQASPEIFSGMTAYLKAQGFNPMSISYASEKGVSTSSAALSDFLGKKKAELTSMGIQAKRFDLIAHSMGGLVARYYTCSSEYSSKGNVRKLIFVSVPQRGSPFAAIGLKYYDDQGIRDLLTDGSLYSKIFPSMTNKGLNPSIQTGSIIGRYDEVVSAESASLAEWNIKTELFDVGDSNFTVDKLLSGEILQAANHKLILYNKKVYDRIKQMLDTDLSFPSTK